MLDATVAENLTLGRADVTGRFAIDRARVARFAERGSPSSTSGRRIRRDRAHAVGRQPAKDRDRARAVAAEARRASSRASRRAASISARCSRIHDRLRAAAKAAPACSSISADLDELLALCHRIVVLLRGRIVGEAAAAPARATRSAH